jgi:hypothetical protein
MPLSSKGQEILSNLDKEYGAEKGKQVLYAGKNKGTFTGIDAVADAVSAMCDSVDKLAARFDDHRVIGGVQIQPTAQQINNNLGLRFDQAHRIGRG